MSDSTMWTGLLHAGLDVDSRDAAHAVGTCCPTPGGLTSREAIELVRGVAAHGLTAVDIVECAPTLDPTVATSLIANRIAIEAMAFHAGAGQSSATMSGVERQGS